MRRKILNILILLVLTRAFSNAQVSGYNMLEYQYGTLPEDTTKNYSTLFNKTHFNYTSKNLLVFGRFESFYSPVEDRNYARITKYGIEYADKGLSLKVGTLNETLARGLLLRSYEIPSALLEDKGFRVRQSFYRDVLGAQGKYTSKHFSISLLRGSPLFNLLPPTLPDKDRRPQIIEAVRSSVNCFGQTFEIGFLRNIENQVSTNYPWIAFQGTVAENYSYYLSYTHKIGQLSEFTRIGSNYSYGFYSNMAASFNNLSFNLELKSYSDLLLGSGYNEPPALIKEHSYRLLNRSSHVLLPQNERGSQFDVFYSPEDGSRFNFNHSLAINSLGNEYRYTSYYLEYYRPFDPYAIKLFADYANDEFNSEKNRITTGGTAERNKSGFHYEMQVELQAFKRFENLVTNQAFSFEFGKSPLYSLGSILELSNDPFLVSTDNKRSWVGFYGKYKYSDKSSFMIFGGQRRGGPACTAGICYEVLDFEGVEIRWNTKF